MALKYNHDESTLEIIAYDINTAYWEAARFASQNNLILIPPIKVVDITPGTNPPQINTYLIRVKSPEITPRILKHEGTDFI